MTESNYQSIIDEAERRSPDLSFESAAQRGITSLSSDTKERALENYRRRIYDAWSVLRAANIIEQSDSKRFKYNKQVLEGPKAGKKEDSSKMTISADKLRRVLESLSKIESTRNARPSVHHQQRSSSRKESDKWGEDHA